MHGPVECGERFEHLSIEQKAIFSSQGERFEDIFGINDDSVNAL